MAGPASLDAHTPTLAVVDPRGLTLRSVAYCRSEPGQTAQRRVTRHGLDALGRDTCAWDPRAWAAGAAPGRSTGFSLSGQPLLSESNDAGWRLQLLSVAGRCCGQWDSRGNRRWTTHDPLQRPVSVCEQAGDEPAQTVERLEYVGMDAACAADNLCGRLRRHDDPGGSVFTQGYALNGQPIRQARRFASSMQTPDWPEAEDLREALLEPGEGYVSEVRFAATGEVLLRVDARGNRQCTALDLAGSPRALALQRPSDDEPQWLRDAVRYDAMNRVISERAGNGVLTERTFCPQDGRLTRLLCRLPGRGPLQDLNYRYDPSGNVLEIEDRTLAVSWSRNQRMAGLRQMVYDSLYQLIEARGVEVDRPEHGPGLPPLLDLPPDPSRLINYQQRFSYDASRNLVQRQHSGAAGLRMAIAASSNRALPSRPDGSLPDEQEINAAYDGCGNLIALPGVAALQWNPRNQLQRVVLIRRESGADDDEWHAYDAAGNRVRKLASAEGASRSRRSEVRYLPGLELHSNSATGEQRQVIVAGEGARVLHWAAGRPEGIPEGQIRYQFADHLGSVALEVDEQAGVLTQETCYPFGGTALWAGNSELSASYKSRRFSGKERDACGLYYFGLRYYAPWLGRWLNPDPLGEVDGLNLYGMVANNPVSLRDGNGGQGIPAVAHYYWSGADLPEDNLYNMLLFKTMNPDWQVNIWGLRARQWSRALMTMEDSMDPAERYLVKDSGSGIARRAPDEMFAALSRIYPSAHQVQGIFERERSGAYANPAAASDAFRLGAMVAYGGLYMDGDVAVTGAVELDPGEGDFFIHTKAPAVSNGVIASVPGSATGKRLLDQLVEEYSPNAQINQLIPEVAWTTKRSRSGKEGLTSRMRLTMGMSGPSMISGVLGADRIARDAGVIPIDAFVSFVKSPHDGGVRERSVDQLFARGALRGIDAQGSWATMRPGRRSSLA